MQGKCYEDSVDFQDYPIVRFRSMLAAQSRQDSPQWGLPEGAKARLGKGTISDIQYSPDGARLAVASSIGIWLYDTATHQEVALLAPNMYVESVAYSPDGRTIASTSRDNAIQIWDTVTGNLRLTINGSGLVNNIAFSPDGRTLASGSGNTIRLWGTGGRDTTIRLWDADTGNLRLTITGHTGFINCVAFSPDSSTIVSGSRDTTIRLWNADTGNLRRTIDASSSVESIAFSPDSTTIASGNGSIRLWDADTGNLRLTIAESGSVESITFSPDGGPSLAGVETLPSGCGTPTREISG